MGEITEEMEEIIEEMGKITEEDVVIAYLDEITNIIIVMCSLIKKNRKRIDILMEKAEQCWDKTQFSPEAKREFGEKMDETRELIKEIFPEIDEGVEEDLIELTKEFSGGV